jgi:hypothetical protein
MTQKYVCTVESQNCTIKETRIGWNRISAVNKTNKIKTRKVNF